MSKKFNFIKSSLMGSSTIMGGILGSNLGGGHVHGPHCNHGHDHSHDHHDHGHVHGSDCNHGHVHDENCGHKHD